MAGWVQDTTSGKADNWNYLDNNGNKATNVWKQDSTGKWAYLNDTGDWAKNTVAKDSNGWQSIGSDGYWTGKTVAPPTPTVKPLTIDQSSKPAPLTLPTAPAYSAYNPNLNMSDYISQAGTLLAPQWDVTKQTINDQNTQNIQTANNDSIRRGISRGSYAGDRVDTLNNNNTKNIANALVSQNANVNSLASTNYNNAWDRGYKLNSDQNNWNWQNYNSGVNNAQNKYTNDWNAYRANVGDQTAVYNANTDNLWKNYNSDTSNYQFDTNRNDKLNQQAISNDQWKQTFDYNKEQDAANRALALKKSNSSGGSGNSGSSSNSTTNKEQILEAYNEGVSTNMPATAYWLTQNQNAIIKAGGSSLWDSLTADFEKKYGQTVGVATNLTQSNAQNNDNNNAWTGSRKVTSSTGSQI